MSPSRSTEAGGRRFRIEGVDLGYPTLFRDGASAAGLFVVDARVAQRSIEASGFEIAEIAPGRAILAFTCVHYTDSDCGVYDETAQAFFVRRQGPRRGGLGSVPGIGRYLSSWHELLTGSVATHTWRLQVTTRLSQECGLQMWGFPKELGQIDFRQEGGRARCALRMDDRLVFDFDMKAGGSRTPAPITSTVYSIYEGGQHASQLTQAYRDSSYRPGGARIALGDHPVADELRALGLPKRPLLATWNGHLAFRMSAPQKL